MSEKLKLACRLFDVDPEMVGQCGPLVSEKIEEAGRQVLLSAARFAIDRINSPLCNKPAGFKVYDELAPWNELDVKLFCGEATGKPMGMLTTCPSSASHGYAVELIEADNSLIEGKVGEQ